MRYENNLELSKPKPELPANTYYAAVAQVFPEAFDFNDDPQVDGIVFKVPFSLYGKRTWNFVTVGRNKGVLSIDMREDISEVVTGDLLEALRMFRLTYF